MVDVKMSKLNRFQFCFLNSRFQFKAVCRRWRDWDKRPTNQLVHSVS